MSILKCNVLYSISFSNMLQMGSSKPWPEALEAIIASREISAQSLINYFQPLIDYLKEQNEMNGDTVGWAEMYTPKGGQIEINKNTFSLFLFTKDSHISSTTSLSMDPAIIIAPALPGTHLIHMLGRERERER